MTNYTNSDKPAVVRMDEPPQQAVEPDSRRAEALLKRLGGSINEMRATLIGLIELTETGATVNEPPFARELDQHAEDFSAWLYTLNIWEGIYVCEMKPAGIGAKELARGL